MTASPPQSDVGGLPKPLSDGILLRRSFPEACSGPCCVILDNPLNSWLGEILCLFKAAEGSAR